MEMKFQTCFWNTINIPLKKKTLVKYKYNGSRLLRAVYMLSTGEWQNDKYLYDRQASWLRRNWKRGNPRLCPVRKRVCVRMGGCVFRIYNSVICGFVCNQFITFALDEINVHVDACTVRTFNFSDLLCCHSICRMRLLLLNIITSIFPSFFLFVIIFAIFAKTNI